MRTITIRKMPPELEAHLEEQARKEGTSMASTVIRLLMAATGLQRSRRGGPYDDLDDLAGTWTEAEADAFDRAVEEQRPIDPEVWQATGTET